MIDLDSSEGSNDSSLEEYKPFFLNVRFIQFWVNEEDYTSEINSKESGGNSEEVTPVPISNTVVKLFSADGSWGFPPARVGRCQALKKSLPLMVVAFFVFKHELHLSRKSHQTLQQLIPA